jgi:hypothetical protein
VQRYRPSSVLVVAILQIVFGALALLLNVCGGGFQLAGGNKVFMPQGNPQAAQQQQFQDDLENMLKERAPYYQATQYGGLVLGLAAAAVMIASGIGLLKMRRWGRWLAIGYACYSIASTILYMVYALTVTLPIMREFVAQERLKPNLPPAQAMALNMMDTMATAAAFVPLVFLAYPVVLLIVLFLPQVRAAFREEPAERAEEDDDEPLDVELDTPRDHGDDAGAIKKPDAPPP